MDTRLLQKALADFQKKKAAFDAQMKILKTKEFTVTVGGDLITVVANGNFEIVSCEISEKILGDKETIQDLIISAVNDVFKKINEEMKQTETSFVPKGIF